MPSKMQPMSTSRVTAHGRSRPPALSARTRASVTKRLRTVASAMATATTVAMEQRLTWFSSLDANTRSWVSVLARNGIDAFIEWFADPDSDASPGDVFAAAPPTLARSISLHQTVELVRTTIDVIEEQAHELMSRSDRPPVLDALLLYSRDLAFAAAEVYARAAETRGAWDARFEALVVDSVVRGEADETVLSRASALGWQTTGAVAVVAGQAPSVDLPHDGNLLRRSGRRHGLDLLSAVQGDRLILIAGGTAIDEGQHLAAVGHLTEHFGPDAIVVGPVVDHLVDAHSSAREALSGLRAAVAWPTAPRPVATADLLPERALNGDGHARRHLGRHLYGSLVDAGGALLETLVAFLDQGSSIEGASRVLFVHANTVRYRLRRIHEVTGFNPTDAREAYVLQMAVTLGRLLS